MKWEYATIERSKVLFGGVTLCLPGGQSQNFSSDLVSLTEVLNSLGRDGWQVVACGGTQTSAVWTLQREIGA